MGNQIGNIIEDRKASEEIIEVGLRLAKGAWQAVGKKTGCDPMGRKIDILLI